MALCNKVIWSEGMFLKPQHLQQQDRYIAYNIKHKATALGQNNWGITRLVIDPELLNVGKFALSAAEGFFQDGTYFNMPAEDSLPLPLEITTGNEVIYLAVREQLAGHADTKMPGFSNDSVYRYRSELLSVADVNADFESRAEVEIGKLQLKLLCESDLRQGYCCFPIAQIKEVSASQQITLDKLFMVTCLDIHAVEVLVTGLEEISSLLYQRGEAIARELLNGDKQKLNPELHDVLLLQLVNRYQALVNHYLDGFCHPEMLYRLLIQLISEIATFTQNNRRPQRLPQYRHHDLGSVFQPIFDRLRQCFSIVFEQKIIRIPLEENDYGIKVGVVADKQLFKTAEFIMIIQPKLSEQEVTDEMLTQIKIGSVETINNLINHALPGLSFSLLTIVPRQLNFQLNASYFRLNDQDPEWGSLRLSGGIAIHTSGPFAISDIELWAIRT